MATTLDAAKLAEQVADRVRDLLRRRRAVPHATYRVQLHADFTFRDVQALVPYLAALGVSDLYASPYLKARQGSRHGYDVCDHNRLNPELGTSDDFEALCATLAEHGMRQVLDIVPNHMGITSDDNTWWRDVLENGQSSPFAHYFDIDWYPVKAELAGKVLLPVLGDQYGHVLEAGQLKLAFAEGSFSVNYFHQSFPLDPRTTTDLLDHDRETLRRELGPESPALWEFESIRSGLEHLPDTLTVFPDAMAERRREKEILRRRLAALVASEPGVAVAIERSVAWFNGQVGEPETFDPLDQLLRRQPYRLSHWKAAADEINYRRFFDINELAAVCMEDAEVFQHAHRLVTELLVRGDVLGLRIDHIDGLYNPREYLRRLQWKFVRALARAIFEREFATAVEGAAWHDVAEATLAALVPLVGSELPALWQEADARPAPERLLPAKLDHATNDLPPAGDASAGEHAPPLYVVVEKILGPTEPLPQDWATAGTTGYDFLNSLGGLFIDPVGRQAVIKTYDRFLGRHFDFHEVAYTAKKLILRSALSSEVQVLAHRLNRISERQRRFCDFTLNTLRQALREVLTCFPVYRTYIDSADVSEEGRHVVLQAVAQARRRNPTLDGALFDFIRDVFLSADWATKESANYYERMLFVGRCQQITSPAMAKGIEDTAFYQYVPLVSENEVGGDPPHSVTTVEAFHRDNLERRTQRPNSLTCTTTHDTKRSEDVRARISVLSEVPHLWRVALNRFARWNRRFRREVDGEEAPSRNAEYLFYQSLLGVWPLVRPDEVALRELTARMQTYMEKATREAKLRTSWINPHAEYDRAVAEFVAHALDPVRSARFLQELQAFHERIVDWGLYTALSQTFGKLLSPGVPDIYQGQELWDFSLVDPDNRRPVDYDRRRAALDEFTAAEQRQDGSLYEMARQLGRHVRDERAKLFVTWRALQFRRAHARLFGEGEYRPLEVRGGQAAHVCAWSWQGAAPDEGAIAVMPRLLARLTPAAEGEMTPPPLGPAIWGDTMLVAEGLAGVKFRQVFTGEELAWRDEGVPLAEVLADFPVALLEKA
ncbi:MAG: malto-oligosyltrehalose synthase [Pirellulales bacterium]|nr:malto-oligosyltrehalose synthase [Pirellulales bacterium]